MLPAQACTSLALAFTRHPEARQYFVAEGGVLAIMELLDSEAQRVLEPVLELINSYVGGDPRSLHSLCLLGMVPAVCRCARALAPGLPACCRCLLPLPAAAAPWPVLGTGTAGGRPACLSAQVRAGALAAVVAPQGRWFRGAAVHVAGDAADVCGLPRPARAGAHAGQQHQHPASDGAAGAAAADQHRGRGVHMAHADQRRPHAAQQLLQVRPGCCCCCCWGLWAVAVAGCCCSQATFGRPLQRPLAMVRSCAAVARWPLQRQRQASAPCSPPPPWSAPGPKCRRSSNRAGPGLALAQGQAGFNPKEYNALSPPPPYCRCRILVQYGLVPRLFRIVQQLMALNAKRQQQAAPPHKSFYDTANEAAPAGAAASGGSRALAARAPCGTPRCRGGWQHTALASPCAWRRTLRGWCPRPLLGSVPCTLACGRRRGHLHAVPCRLRVRAPTCAGCRL
jgi:hypothetical protein